MKRDLSRIDLARFCNRRRLLASGAAALATGLSSSRFGAIALAQPPANGARRASLAPRARTLQSLQRGWEYLKRVQNDDGSYGAGLYGRNVGVCSLATLALMAAGNTPGRGPFGATVSRGLDFVLSCCQESGFITYGESVSHGPMYEHGFGTLLLAEAYGMTANASLRGKLTAAVKLIVDKQNAEGGWRYFPERRDADLSVTICQIMALRAAKNAGLYVPAATVERCVEYVKRSQNGDGGFMYQLSIGGPSKFPRSAAGIVALHNAGIYEGDEIDRGLEYLMGFLPGKAASLAENHYLYGHYYAVQAMYQAGGDYWTKWYPAIETELVERQHKDGYWVDTISPVYGTAMACLVLIMPTNHLPVFQK